MGQEIQDSYEGSDEEIKEKQLEEFDKKILSLKQQGKDMTVISALLHSMQ